MKEHDSTIMEMSGEQVGHAQLKMLHVCWCFACYEVTKPCNTLHCVHAYLQHARLLLAVLTLTLANYSICMNGYAPNLQK